MKKLTLSLCALVALAPGVFAGPVETKDVKESAVVQTDCYRNEEWNVDIFGTYAFTGNEWEDDTYLEADHAFGGGMGVNFFFLRYFGVGFDGYFLRAHGDGFGEFTGNLTFRYPIPNSCWSPYAFGGAGLVFNAADRVSRFNNGTNDADTEAVGQFGAGIEYRFTPNISVMNDISWHVVNGADNNYGLVRAGIRFSF